jgi:type IV pilus assembly protein PilE
MKKGFTLIEIIIVLIIIGILATLGFTQYVNMLERGRRAEAKSTLGTIRTLAVARYQEMGSYPDDNVLVTELGLPTGTCNTAFYFRYAIDSISGAATATRCTGGGKTPDATTAYTLRLAVDGTMSGSW